MILGVETMTEMRATGNFQIHTEGNVSGSSWTLSTDVALTSDS